MKFIWSEYLPTPQNQTAYADAMKNTELQQENMRNISYHSLSYNANVLLFFSQNPKTTPQPPTITINNNPKPKPQQAPCNNPRSVVAAVARAKIMLLCEKG